MELKQPLLLPAPVPAPPVGEQAPSQANSLIPLDSVTYAFVCHGCQRIVHRFVETTFLPLGLTICFGTRSLLYSVEMRRNHPHPFDHLLDPDQNPDDRSVAFTTVLCEACFAPVRTHYAENKIKLAQWQPSYDEVLAMCDRWDRVAVAAFRRHVRARIQGFEVCQLPEIIGDDAYAMVSNKRLPYRQRRQAFEQILDSRKAEIEAYMTVGFPLETVWDTKAFEAVHERSRRLASDLGLAGPVGITRPLEPPHEVPYGTFRQAASNITGAAAEAMTWPALQGLSVFDTTAMLDEARARIQLPAIDDFAQQLRTKCRQLVNMQFLMLGCEVRWLNNQ